MNPANIEVLVLTVPSVTEHIVENQLVGFDGAPCGADEAVQGVACHGATVGQDITIITIGVVEMIAANAIATGDKVYSDSEGNVTSIGTHHPFGHALTGGGVGDVVAILMR